MRKILFRGRTLEEDECIKKGAWIEGGLFIQEENDVKEFAAYILTPSLSSVANAHLVDPETVGRFTNLTDENNVKIFEDDIVECFSEGVNARGTVQQRKDGLWIIYPNWQRHIMWGLCPDEYSKTTVRVIGNIHDNPELLEE